METNSEPQVVPTTEAPRRDRIAPLWHSLVLVGIIVVFSAGGATSEHQFRHQHGLILQYLLTMAFEWLLVLYTCWGIRRTGVVSIREVIGGRWNTVEEFLLDIGIAAGFWFCAALVLAACGYALGFGNAGNIEEAKRQLGFLIPHTRAEVILWFFVSATAGFCEEFMFRGYLQRQFSLLSGNPWLGMGLSAIAFGLAHGYEGWRRMLLIAVYGMMFSVLAHYRRSTRPGMIAHAWHDTFSGLALRVLFK